MNRKFGQVVVILMIAAVGYSALMTPGARFAVDIMLLKRLLLYVLLGSCAYALWATMKPPRRPPGI